MISRYLLIIIVVLGVMNMLNAKGMKEYCISSLMLVVSTVAGMILYTYYYYYFVRKENKWTQDDLIPGFILEKQTDYDMEYAFDLEKFVDFKMIQSNVNAQVENGSITADEVKLWMMESLAPVFEDKEKMLVFSGYSWYIRKK